MKIAIASGKGGTGKTTVATSLALALAKVGQAVTFLDCDVEAPNAHLFLQPRLETQVPVEKRIPQVDPELCQACGRCAEVCQYHAIVVLGTKTLVFTQLCHGCGSCSLECPHGAITEVPDKLGLLEAGPASLGIDFRRGLLDIGEPMAVPVIRQLKQWPAPAGNAPASHAPVLDAPALGVAIALWDCPPGTSCPVVEALRGADFVLLVTEPTPFGLHDLRLAHEVCRELSIPAGVIINRWSDQGSGDQQVDEYCSMTGLPVLMRIPLDRRIGAGIAQGQTLLEIDPLYQELFAQLYRQIEQQIAVPGAVR